MSALVRSAQAITVAFTTHNYSTGALTNGDSTPTGTIYVNGTADAASVTVTNITTGRYKAAVTLPSLSIGDMVDLFIAATVSSVAGGGIVWRGTCAISIDSNGRLDIIKVAGTSQTARDLGASVLLSPGTGTGQISLSSGAVTAGTVSDKTGYSLTQSFPSNFASLGINASGHISRVTLTDTVTTYTGDTPQTGDSYARIGATGSGLTSLAQASSWTAGLATNLAGANFATLQSEVDDIYSAFEDDGVSSYRLTAGALVNAYTTGNVATLLSRSAAGPHLASTFGKYLSDAGIAGAQLQTAMEADGLVYRFTENALEEGVAGGSGATAAEVWAYTTRTLTSIAPITWVSATSESGSVEIVQGDDYNATDDTQIDWTCSGWPSFTSGSVAVVIAKNGEETTLTGSVASSTVARLTLTAAQSAAIESGRYAMQVHVTLSSGRKVTPVIGFMLVKDRLG